MRGWIIYKDSANAIKPETYEINRILEAAEQENIELEVYSPEDFDLTSSDVQKRFPDIPEYMGTNPSYMGLGIKREKPKHY